MIKKATVIRTNRILSVGILMPTMSINDQRIDIYIYIYFFEVVTILRKEIERLGLLPSLENWATNLAAITANW